MDAKSPLPLESAFPVVHRDFRKNPVATIMRTNMISWAVLFSLGAIWGLAMPIMRIAVSTGHQQLGLIFWQSLISCAALGIFLLVNGGFRGLNRRRLATSAIISFVGTILPGFCAYKAAYHLPAGVMSIIISLVPMTTLPIALLIGLEKFQTTRMLGIIFGAIAIFLLLGPDASLPDPSAAIFVLVAAGASIFYGIEANFVAKFGTAGLGPVEILFWASLIGAAVFGPLALISGQWVDLTVAWGAPEFALLTLAIMHAFGYSSYVWLVGYAGSVFSTQVAYLVTLFGVFWSIVLLQEHYSGWIWAALAFMVVGLFLVRPKRSQSAAMATR
ncbi:MAG: DMT family transporter [Albidovulum sp.]|nr:DMT family transporter [Albidovulum sp.]